jgi:hypothetical protein
MRSLLAKEIRLLLPAYVAGLLLAVVSAWLAVESVWLHPGNVSPAPDDYTVLPFAFGIVLLAVSSFGREFWLNTFALSLAQPLERGRIWWTKVALLVAAVASVFVLWCVACLASGTYVDSRFGHLIWKEPFNLGAMATILAFVGGLWTTLLLRQVAAAFWFTILVPGVLGMLVTMCGGSDAMVYCALGLYAVGGFWLANWLFFRAQEVGWTGGTVILPWKRSADASRPAIRSRRPLAALFQKELQLHQIMLAGMGGLFVLHLGVAVLRKARHDTLSNTTLTVLELFGWLWFVVPFLIGAASVAEERRLGVMESHLILPVSRRRQFAMKLVVVLALGGLLSAVLFWTAEGIAATLGLHSADSLFSVPFGFHGLLLLSLIMVLIALLAFYASTLTRNLLQALAAAVASLVAFGLILYNASYRNPFLLFGQVLWQGYLIYYILFPTLTVAVVWLAWRNFKSVSQTGWLWLRNLLVLAGALAFILASTAIIYNRAWELIMPLESAHGPPRLAGTQPSNMNFFGFGRSLTVLLPDGRAWTDFLIPNQGHLLLSIGRQPVSGDQPFVTEDTGFRIGAGWPSWGPRQFLPGSNWVNVVRLFSDVAGVRSDGTLWVSEKPCPPKWVIKGDRLVSFHSEMPDMVRFGEETNWQNVMDLDGAWFDSGHCTVLLRNDGTLWFWGTNSFNYTNNPPWPGLGSFQPQRLVEGSDWAKVLTLDTLLYGIKKDGTAWVLLGTNQDSTPPAKPWQHQPEWKIGPGLRTVRAPQFDHMKSLVMVQNLDVGLREDGTLWARKTSRFSGVDQFTADPMRQIGNDSDWTVIAASFGSMMAGLKADGSLWLWHQDPLGFLDEHPVPLGTHHDWRGVTMYGGVVSLAADGSLWDWNARSAFGWEQPMMIPSRRPIKIENIFDK